MSFLTSRCLLLQKEQRSTSPFPVFFDIQPPAGIETIVGGCRGPVNASTRPFSNLAHPARLTAAHGGDSPPLFAVEILGNRKERALAGEPGNRRWRAPVEPIDWPLSR